ncbi:uncharacterized protein LOC119083845 [Bradysia coprophila]|uniref:uncharacterized protein LOC119067817 n=1 Tax=Bradysia coprophila TaxID=38358 RepID=UPI00187DC3A3|nr:uncharacterized protein LOC119067817 [Bradysia coprophila]XP_037049546.1 uncharacterized protein LOC119083845 [Bradysia coprophila]
MQPRINLLKKLAGTSWGANATVLRTSALALVYSVAEYGSAIWIKSAHTNIIDVALNEALRVITGAVASTPIEWLHVLANIEPPAIRRYKAFAREWEKIGSMDELPIHDDLNNIPAPRLTSRHPLWKTLKYGIGTRSDYKASWIRFAEEGMDTIEPNTNRTRELREVFIPMEPGRFCWL